MPKDKRHIGESNSLNQRNPVNTVSSTNYFPIQCLDACLVLGHRSPLSSKQTIHATGQQKYSVSILEACFP